MAVSVLQQAPKLKTNSQLPASPAFPAAQDLRAARAALAAAEASLARALARAEAVYAGTAPGNYEVAALIAHHWQGQVQQHLQRLERLQAALAPRLVAGA